MNADTADRAQRVERIAALLGEIEELSHRAHAVPLPLLIKTLEDARNVLKNYARLTLSDGDPQPDVDNAILERMYRTLAAGRRPLEP